MSSPRQETPHTISSYEIKKFQNAGSFLWDETNPKSSGLRSFNTLRIPWIVDELCRARSINKDQERPLEGLNILDVGCGAGLLTEALARYGCTIVGIDPCAEMVYEAKKHASLDEEALKNLSYVNDCIEKHSEKFPQYYDVVIASEVLEHVDNADLFVELCCKCLKPGGSIFVTTFNKTWTSWLIAIVLYEYIAGLIPYGNHSWNKFITPEDLTADLKKYHCQTVKVWGAYYSFLLSKWYWSSNSWVNYGLHAVKDKI